MTDYQDLIDNPAETLSVEYKSWLDIKDNSGARASLARHIAAIANHGGGLIVFGFNDDLTITTPSPFIENHITRDAVAAVVKKYLEPTFHCGVEIIRSASGTLHPVIVVPSHESVPICSKAGGPVVDGKPQGIAQAVYYIRKAGPESERVLSAAEWAPIIRRCALHERSSILTAIEASIRGGTQSTDADKSEELATWHNAAFVSYKKAVRQYDASEIFARQNVQFSYSILRGDGQTLDPITIKETLLLQMHNEVMDRVRSGWSMFYPFTRTEIAPYFNVDELSGEGDNDFIECLMLRDQPRRDLTSDMWRITPSGKATIIRPYWEDDKSWCDQFKIAPGTTFNPKNHIRAVGELVRHAQAFGEKFDSPVTVNFLCEWRGLSGRSIYDPNSYFSVGGAAIADIRKVSKEVPFISLANSWPDIVSELTASVVRGFNTSFRITPDWVRGQAPTWIQI